MDRKVPFLIRVFIWFARLASVGMYLLILLAILDIGPHIMGGEHVTRTEWLHIAAPLVAVLGVLMACISYGSAARKPWSRHVVIALFVLIVLYAAILGALDLDSSRDHVACDYQRNRVRLHLGLVFLFQTKRGGLFSGAEEPITESPLVALRVMIRQARRLPAAQAGSLCSDSLPTDLTVFVLFFQLRLQRLK